MRMTFTGVVCAVLAVGATGLASPGAPTATADEAPRIRAARVMENLGRGVVAVRSGTAHGTTPIWERRLRKPCSATSSEA